MPVRVAESSAPSQVSGTFFSLASSILLLNHSRFFRIVTVPVIVFWLSELIIASINEFFMEIVVQYVGPISNFELIELDFVWYLALELSQKQNPNHFWRLLSRGKLISRTFAWNLKSVLPSCLFESMKYVYIGDSCHCLLTTWKVEDWRADSCSLGSALLLLQS